MHSRLTVLLSLSLAAPLQAQLPVINEIHFDPLPKTSPEEFVELFNPTGTAIDLGGWAFSEGIDYTFPAGTLIEPGEYLVVAEDPAVLTSRFGGPLTSGSVLGPYLGRLANDGEELVLRDREGAVADRVEYSVGFPWPIAANGLGSSMELIHPSLDNDLGGSWRASGMAETGLSTRRYFIGAGENWRYRKGSSEPPAGWRQVSFVEDGSWLDGQAPIGYGDADDNTVLGDMQNGYSTVYLRRAFTIDNEADLPSRLMLGLYVDDGAVVWINEREVLRLHVSPGDKAHDDLGESHEAEWEEVSLPSPASYLRVGPNVLAVHALNTTLGSSDFSIDAELFVPADGEGVLGLPTPGAMNSVYSENAPPQIRQVQHSLAQPPAQRSNVVTAKITDPDGVGAVELRYQVVLPGHYIPAFLPVPLSSLMANAEQPRPPNPEFEAAASWTTIPMVDDGSRLDAAAGDGVYTATVPGFDHRTLIRYRIWARDTRGASVRVPHADDPSLNFAYFVYDGVPDYVAETSILGRPTIHSAEDLTALPVYMLLTRNRDLVECIAANPAQQIPQGNQARFAFNWEGAFVYDGIVYDHINYRLRGANGRYQVPPGNPSNTAGKRHWRFRFNRGHLLRARDRWGNLYPSPWSVLNTGRMFGNRLDGNWGLGDQVNDLIWNAYGVPAAYGHPFHWRVIDGVEEAPSGSNGQYLGDFWGIARAFENYDVRFLEAHKLPKGNLYKLVNQTRIGLEQQRYQAADAVDDGSDHDNIENNLRASRSSAWLDAHVHYEKWYHYHAVAQAIRHYDYWPDANKNAAWYFEPVYTPENNFLGRMWTLPFDADASWGPTWNEGKDRPYDAIYSGGGKPEFQIAYRNHLREVRDLLWQRDQLELIIGQTAAFMVPLEAADIDRWRNAPPEAGRQYFSATSQRNLEGKVADMLRFAFTGGSWPGGSVGAGGRAAFLDSLADGPDAALLPSTPTLSPTDPEGFPIDALTFRCSAFDDPQGAGTFAAMKWRIAETTAFPDPGSIPLSDPIWKTEPVKLELEAAWESDELTTFQPELTIPLRFVKVGANYRVRVRMKDSSERWSHWSEPVQFVAGPPSGPIPQLDDLRITEIMYNPLGGSEFEFIELQNRGTQPLDLRDVWFSDGIEFDFADSSVTSLGPGEAIVLVENAEAFSQRYDLSGITVAGQYGGRLSNAGERITLTYGANLTILDFVFLDSWYPTTDGEGLSLNIVDVQGPPELWNDPQNWFAGSVLHGTPGSADPGSGGAGFLRPGDANLNGLVEIGDVVTLLLLVYRGDVVRLPCDGDSPGEGANLALLDANGDGAVDQSDAIQLLGYLFLAGPAHSGGANCNFIEGCSSICGG